LRTVRGTSTDISLRYLQLAALSLLVVNVLPIHPLDGGHMLASFAEMLLTRRIQQDPRIPLSIDGEGHEEEGHMRSSISRQSSIKKQIAWLERSIGLVVVALLGLLCLSEVLQIMRTPFS
jgi:membrane-associated protease RseP (regulator of RpoE activity)